MSAWTQDEDGSATSEVYSSGIDENTVILKSDLSGTDDVTGEASEECLTLTAQSMPTQTVTGTLTLAQASS